MRKKKSKSAKQFDWLVRKIVGNRLKEIGLVRAASADDAVAQAIEDFGLRPIDKKRLIAQPA